MKIRYRAKVTPLREGHKQLNQAKWQYASATSVSGALHFLMRRYPYPKFIVDTPIPDPVNSAGNLRSGKGISWR